MPRACWDAEAPPVISERRHNTAVQRHRAFLQDLHDRKAHERAALAKAEDSGAAMHEREVGFNVLFNGANQRTRAAGLTAAHRRLPLQTGCVSPGSPQQQHQLVEPPQPPAAKRRQLAAAGLASFAEGLPRFAGGLPRRRRWSLEQPVVVLDTHTGDLLRVLPTRRLLPALPGTRLPGSDGCHHGSAGPIEGVPAPWPATGARPLRALLEPPASPERPEEPDEEEEEEKAEEEEEAEEEEANEEHATGARNAACECRCAPDSTHPDESQPVEESPTPIPPSRSEGEGATIHRDDHDTLRPLYPTII